MPRDQAAALSNSSTSDQNKVHCNILGCTQTCANLRKTMKHPIMVAMSIFQAHFYIYQPTGRLWYEHTDIQNRKPKQTNYKLNMNQIPKRPVEAP